MTIRSARETIFWTDLHGETVLLSQYDPGKELEELLVSNLVSPADRPKIERHDVSRGIIEESDPHGRGHQVVFESDVGANVSGLVHRELRDGGDIAGSSSWRTGESKVKTPR
ncbi:hypothetical protein [Bradyrhizobium sp. STM 3562]|uniref:hypothetical protein n=1 Tax=Bradyrhizobium sp. STM 3562 TaxID=578924 RepID=UPI00388EDF5D